MSRMHSLSAKFSLNILTVTVIIIVCVVFVVGINSFFYIRDEAQDRSVEGLKDISRRMGAMIEMNEYALDGSSWLISENLDDHRFISRVTHNIMVANEGIEGCALVFTDIRGLHGFRGTCLSSYRTDDGVLKDTVIMAGRYDYSELDWYNKVTGTKAPTWSSPFYESENGKECLHVTYSVPVFNREGEVAAVFASKMNMKSITDLLMNLRPYENSYSCILNTETIYASYPDSLDVMRFNLSQLPQALYTRLLEEQRQADSLKTFVGMDFKGLDGERKFAVFGPLSEGWYVMTVSRYSEVFDELIRFNKFMIVISLLTLLVLLVVIRRTVQRFTQPITQFTFSAMNASKGNFDVKLPQTADTLELVRLRSAMKNMLSSVRNYISELKTSVASNERYESELNIAREIQNSMLPVDFPQTDAVDVFATLSPAKEVGGDLYDFRLASEKLYFSVGDVSGKGVPAALYMAITREAYKLISHKGLDVNGVIGRINNAFCDGNVFNMFITLFSGSLEFESGYVKFCNAGHNPIVVIPPDGKAYLLKAKPNLAAGLVPDFPYEREDLTITPGTRLVLYTDGVTEAEAADKSQFGEDRLLAFASSQNPGMPSKEFVEGLEAAVHSFAGGNPQNDDITIMSVLFKKFKKSENSNE